MAADYVEQIRAVQSVGPYRLLGWSFGGVVAHAMATQLQEQGESVELLVMLDAAPAEKITAEELPEFSEQEMLGFLLSAIGPETDDIPQCELAPEKAADFLRPGGAPVDLLLDEETLRGLRECFERNPRLQTSHVPSRFHGNAVLFASTLGVTDHRKETWEPAEAWRPYVTGDIDVHDVSSEHDRMMQPQALSEIGPVLSTILNQIV
jgi:thioesterase domain-containing protein